MDITTVVGLISGFTFIVMAVYNGGDLSLVVDVPSLLLVVGGSLSALLISFPLREIVQIPTILLYFFGMPRRYMCLVSQWLATGLDTKARQRLVQQFPPDEATEDGAAEIEERLKLGVAVFDRIKTCPLGFGGVGILIGAIIMLANLDDPSAIGPGVAWGEEFTHQAERGN